MMPRLPLVGAVLAACCLGSAAAMGCFEPYDCAPAPGTPCTEWNDTAYVLTGKWVVPCGTCVVIGCGVGSIDAGAGIDVQGQLVIKDYAAECGAGAGPRLTVTTPFFHIQGEVRARATRATSGEPDVRVVLTGEEAHPLVPHGVNADKCGGAGCSVGKKAVAVAGGRLDIRALPEGCRTWTRLAGAVRGASPASVAAPAPAVPTGCGVDIVAHNFDGADTHEWNSHWSPGGFAVEADNGAAGGGKYFVAKGRTGTWQGPMLTLNSYMGCFRADTEYYLSARVRLSAEAGSNATSACSAGDGARCVKAVLFTENTGPAGANRKYWHVKSYGPRTTWGPPGAVVDGEWFWMFAVITFHDYELDTAHMVHRRLYFGDPEAGIDIAIDDVRISHVPPAGLGFAPGAGDVCTALVPFNGDAGSSVGVYTYPFVGSDVRQVSTVRETLGDGSTNAFFRLTGRTEYWHTLKARLEPGCIVEAHVYTFSMRLRMPTAAAPFNIRLFRFHERDGGADRSWRTLTECGGIAQGDGWVTCSVDYAFDAGDAAATRWEYYFETDADAAVHVDVIDVDDVQAVFKHGPVTHLEVAADGIDTCWGPGSEILVTSSTLQYDKHATVRLAGVTAAGGGRYLLAVDGVVDAGVASAAGDAAYAPEVALLSRNVRFEGGADADVLHGGHLIVYHTPGVAQTLEGVEVRRFGQQRNLGRYPIHFHMSKSVAGSVVAKNVVRESLQRCVVVHGSHNVTVRDNVAFDTRGHCFMFEDGVEMDNVFEGNLGAFTQAAARIRDEETDDTPSTFWLTNPRNTIRGNVAAGSSHSGFWYEMRREVREPSASMMNFNPSELPLTAFEGNVAHSNGGHGVQTYPGAGYNPPAQGLARFVGTRSYRNRGHGIFFHNSRNLHVEGGLYADNRVQVDFDRAPGCSVNGATMVGYSSEYRAHAPVAGGWTHCPSSYPLAGVQVHSYWGGGAEHLGADVTNTHFAGFGADTGCAGSSAVEAEHYEDRGYFDVRTTLAGLTFDNATAGHKVSLCRAAAAGQDHIVMRADSTVYGADGYVVSDAARVTALLPAGACTRDEGACAQFCAGVCVRAWSAAVPATTAEELVMVVTDAATGASVTVAGHYEYPTAMGSEEVDVEQHLRSWRRRRFFAHLAAGGSYTVRFVLDGVEHWPTFVETQFEDEPGACAGSVDVEVVRPAGDSPQCGNLIRNGDMEQGAAGWVTTAGGLRVVEEPGQGQALTNEVRAARWYGLVHFLDTRCITAGAEYTMVAKVKLYEADGVTPFSCEGTTCPHAVMRTSKGVDQYDYTWTAVAELNTAWNLGEWNVVYGDITFSEAHAAAENAYIYFDDAPANIVAVWDDVSMVPSATPPPCSDVVLDDSFDGGVLDFADWDGHGASYEVVPGGYLQTSQRTGVWQGPQKEVDMHCITPGVPYRFTARFRVTTTDGLPSACEASAGGSTYGTGCVRVTLYSRDADPAGGADVKRWFGFGYAAPHVDGEWFLYEQEVTFSEVDTDSSNSLNRRLYVEGPETRVDIAMDDVRLERKVCGPVVLDSTFAGGYGRWNSHWSPGGYRLRSEASHTAGDAYFVAVGRSHTWHGPMHRLPAECMEPDVEYRITAKVRLTSVKADGTPSNCQATGSNCLNLYLFSQDQDGARRWTWYGNGGQHNDGEWFDFDHTTTFSALEVDTSVIQYRRLYFQNVEADVEIAVDNVRIERV